MVVTETFIPSSETDNEADGPDALATRLPEASDIVTSGSREMKLVAPTSMGMSEFPGVDIWAIPEGVRANTLAVPGKLSEDLESSPVVMGTSTT